ncbi:MAG: Trk system potassium transporter TrkA [Clostridiales bacterium]|nr:Trk system potassium transporter TrkA [Clostridiales bacterium]
MNIIILGAGKLGIRLIEALIDGDNEITLVDTNEEKLRIISEQHDILTYTGDVKSISLLKYIGIQNYDFLVSCTASDDTNIIAASIAKILGCKNVVARVTQPEHTEQIEFLSEHFGIDQLINPDMLIASEIYHYLVDKYSISNGVYKAKRIAVVEVSMNNEPQLIGKSLVDFRRVHPNMIVIGISRRGKIIIPHGTDIFEANDILYIAGEENMMMDVARNIFSRHKYIKENQQLMIVGGGRTGFFLAKKMIDYGARVKIIERDRKRCNYLNNGLSRAEVINGNGADISLLEEEGLEDMQAVVTATGFDEQNLLVSLSAKNHGVDDVITKISHESYDSIIEKLGIDVVLNPLDITASLILRMVNGEKRVLTNILLHGQAELMQIYVDSNMSFVGVPLKELDLPDFIIIAAINRGDDTIIPDGNTRIKAGDHVVLVCLLSQIGYVERLLKTSHKFGLFR